MALGPMATYRGHGWGYLMTADWSYLPTLSEALMALGVYTAGTLAYDDVHGGWLSVCQMEPHMHGYRGHYQGSIKQSQGPRCMP